MEYIPDIHEIKKIARVTIFWFWYPYVWIVKGADKSNDHCVNKDAKRNYACNTYFKHFKIFKENH